MMGHLFALFSGIVFAIGLTISGMINPSKVIGFLDIFGNWDYSLAFVMAGAVVFNLVSFHILKSKKPVCSSEHFWPSKKEVDKKLVIGAALFGIGWGVAGICPGPGIVNLVSLDQGAMIFVLSMLAGMFLFKLSEKFWS